MSNISYKMKMIRAALSLNQTEFGAKLGTTLSTISKYEQGVSSPGYDFIVKMGKVYGINLNWLIKDQGEMFTEEFLLKTGTDNKPHIRLIKSDNSYSVAESSGVTKEEISRISSNYRALATENDIFELAKKINLPVIIDIETDGKITESKVYGQNGKILSPSQVKRNDDYENLLKKIEKIANNKQKIKFVNLALDAFKDRKALEELKLMVQGIELTLN